MQLQPIGSGVDQCSMGRKISSSSINATGDPPAFDPERLTLSHLAHELNSMLDGSMRCVGLARRLLDQSQRTEAHAFDDAINKLTAAHETMLNMAHLLDRAMHAGTGTIGVHHSNESIGEALHRIVNMVRQIADDCGVAVSVDLSNDAAPLPIGPLGPVVLNGLRNAIEACTDTAPESRRVELSISLINRNELLLIISDTGPGLPEGMVIGQSSKPDGHGFGLDISQRIVDSLGGRMELTNVPFGSGAVMRVRINVERLTDS